MTPELQKLLDESRKQVEAMSPEQREAMVKAQATSLAAAEKWPAQVRELMELAEKLQSSPRAAIYTRDLRAVEHLLGLAFMNVRGSLLEHVVDIVRLKFPRHVILQMDKRGVPGEAEMSACMARVYPSGREKGLWSTSCSPALALLCALLRAAAADQLRRRRRELTDKIIATDGWGAAVGAMAEERSEVIAALRSIDA